MYGDNLINGITGAEASCLVTDTQAHTPGDGKVFFEIQMIDDCVLTEILPAFTGNAITSVVFPMGTVIKGRFTSITLASGKCIAYRGSAQ